MGLETFFGIGTEINQSVLFIDVLDARHFPFTAGKLPDQITLEIIHIQVIPSRPFGTPGKMPAIIKWSEIAVQSDKCGILFNENSSYIPCHRISGQHFKPVLEPVQPLERQLTAVASPGHFDDIVVRGAVDFYRYRFFGRQVNEE